MINYAKYESQRKGVTYGKIFARAVHSEIVDLEGLAEHMTSHNYPYSKGQILGLLDDMVSCIRELVLAGNSVKLPNLGIFKPAIKSKGANTAKEYNLANDVLGVRIACLPSGEMKLSSAFYNGLIKLKSVMEYDRSQLEPSEPGVEGQ